MGIIITINHSISNHSYIPITHFIANHFQQYNKHRIYYNNFIQIRYFNIIIIGYNIFNYHRLCRNDCRILFISGLLLYVYVKFKKLKLETVKLNKDLKASESRKSFGLDAVGNEAFLDCNLSDDDAHGSEEA